MFNIFVIGFSIFLILLDIVTGSIATGWGVLGSMVFIVFLMPVLIILWVWFIRLVFAKKERASKALRIFAVLAFIFSVPVTVIACSKGITLGMQVPFNKTLWEKNIDNRIRYYMTANIIESINKQQLSKQEVISKLGEPYFKYGDTHIGYFLKPDNLFFGLAYSNLLIEFDKHGLVRHISIEHID